MNDLIMLDKQYFKSLSGKEGYVFWDGNSYTKWGQKEFRIHCPDCLTSTNEKIKDYAVNYKFTVSVSNKNRSTVPCGCSPKIEKLGEKYSEDFLYDYKFNYKDSTITVKESFIKDKVLCRYFECSICSKDVELFTERFYTPSHKIVKGLPNCPCNKSYRYTESQTALRCTRKALKVGLAFKGFKEYKGDYKSKNTKCILSCPEHGTWDTCSVDNFLRGRGCPECAQLKRNALKGNRNGYYSEKAEKQDYLYIIKFEDYIKVGRSFNISDRVRGLKSSSGVSYTPEVIKVYCSDHKTVYETEQDLHKQLRLAGHYYKSGWTKETFSLQATDMCFEYLRNTSLKATEGF